MSDLEKSTPSQTAGEGDRRGAGRRPYLKPAFRHEQVFETMALACGKVSFTQLQCLFNRRNS